MYSHSTNQHCHQDTDGKTETETYTQEWEDNSFEEGGGFIQGPFQTLVIVHVQFSIIFVLPLSLLGQADVFSDCVQEDTLKEDASLRRFHLGYKYSSSSMTCLR